MAVSKCIKCENTQFEMVENSPSRSNYKYMFIQCSKCSGVVGVTDFYNLGARINELEKETKSIQNQVVSRTNESLSIVNSNIQILLDAIKAISIKKL